MVGHQEELDFGDLDLIVLDFSNTCQRICLLYDISSVGSQNLVTLIFTKMTFCQRWNTKCMAHILSNSRSSRPIRTPLKASIMLQNSVSMKNSIILVLILLRYEVLT